MALSPKLTRAFDALAGDRNLTQDQRTAASAKARKRLEASGRAIPCYACSHGAWLLRWGREGEHMEWIPMLAACAGGVVLPPHDRGGLGTPPAPWACSEQAGPDIPPARVGAAPIALSRWGGGEAERLQQQQQREGVQRGCS